jgi:hypothetical protein
VVARRECSGFMDRCLAEEPLPAHPVAAGRPTDRENLPATLIGADEIPALIPHTLVFAQLGWTGEPSTLGIDGALSLRCDGNGLTRRVP